LDHSGKLVLEANTKFHVSTLMHRVVIGADNCAAQGFRWAKALRDHLNVAAESMGPTNNGWDFEIDKAVDLQVLHRNLTLGLHEARDFHEINLLHDYLINGFSHFLIEYFHPIINREYKGSVLKDEEYLRSIDKKVGFIAHGSDLIIPSVHKKLERFSPHNELDESRNLELEKSAIIFNEFLQKSNNTSFVSTHNLLHFAPNASWLPVIAKPAYFNLEIKLPKRIPLVVHAPSDPVFKGTRYIEPILLELNRKGFIRYIRCEKLTSGQLLNLINRADVVFDQISLGSYGVLGADAMAAGKVVLGHVSQEARSSFLEEVPIVEISPENVTDKLYDLIASKSSFEKIQVKSRLFAKKYHNGELSAQILKDKFLDT
jgi:hypothetical protein